MSSPDPPASRLCSGRLFRQHVANDIVSAVTERGSYPFPFRTRKSSPSSPMVPGLRARESRSPLDSRGPLPSRQGASSFLQTARPLCRRVPVAGPRSRRHGLSVQAACGSRPLAANARGGFFYARIVRGLRGLAPRREGNGRPGERLADKQTLEAEGRIHVCVRSRLEQGLELGGCFPPFLFGLLQEPSFLLTN